MEGILVDCPHRERRGWGEVTVAAMYGDALPNFESGAYMDQYLQYTRDAQLDDGQIRAVINENDRPFLMWKANSPITVWETYRMFGDKKILADNYDSMLKWMKWLFDHSNYDTGGALRSGKEGAMEFPGLGDWCTPKGNFWTSSNSPEANHFNNSLYAYMLDIAVHIATTLGKTEDAQLLSDRLKVQRMATHNLSYDDITGKYGSGQQVNQAFALIGGVTPSSEKTKVEEVLADNLLYTFPYYDTGSSGQALYTRYFTELGERMDLIYELLIDRHHPSYGYFIDQGETTWPERWSSVGMSKIHTCYTGIGGYFIKGFGGIRADDEAPGMKSMLIKPALVGELTYANTEYKSLYGNVVVNWKKSNNKAKIHIEIPINTKAKIYLPATSKEVIKESGILAENAKGVKFLGSENSEAVGNYVIFSVQSGVYDFDVSSLPVTSLPNPKFVPENLSLIARANASSMFIETEKLPGFEAFKANDSKDTTYWQAGDVNNQYLEFEWLKPQTFNSVEINEKGESIEDYEVQYWDNIKWINVAKGQKCGNNKIHKFQTVTASKCRILIKSAAKAALISEFKIFNTTTN
jgi:alpha-L-rhamnosidase